MVNKIIVVDIETTGWLKSGGLIVEIGIVLLDIETGEVEEIYDELVNEGFPSECHKISWIFQNSDLKYDDVCNAKPLDVIALQKIFDKHPATAYNKRFDFDFLKDRGLVINELPCPMVIATDICKIPSPFGYGSKWPKVQEAWDFLFGEDTGYTEEHRGLDDAKHEAKIVYQLYKMGKFGIPE